MSFGFDIAYKKVDLVANDYFLPSGNELDAMYDELKAYSVGSFSDLWYWSSTDGNSTTVTRQNFADGGGGSVEKAVGTCAVRACRRFNTASGTSYSLRATGPKGGLIFAIVDNGDGTWTYYESSLVNQSDSCAWSNITDSAVPTSATNIGSGKPNTKAIINQVGHTSSAALLCVNYIV